MHRRILNVAEKNDAAKSLSRIMSRGNLTKKEGLSKYNKIFEFDFNILNSSCRMVMTSVSGHLLSMDFLSNFQKWNSCLPVELFEAQVQKFCTGTNIPIKKTLEREIRNCNTLIIWTDGDREGENIGHEIISVCKAVKPRIEIHRARFSEITYRSIMRACENLTRPDNLQSDAVDVRQELDLRIGAAFTRFQTLRLQRIFAAHLKDQLISYGSCQFPTLGFVVSRFKEIDAFISEDFYKIKVTLDTEDGVIDFNWKRVRLFYRHACEVIHQICLENPLATVTSVVSKPKSKWRPLPLDTVEFEKLVSRKLKIGAKEAMKIAEKLYNRGFISYPRTETNQFPSSMNLRQLIEYQTESSEWGDFAKSLVERGPTPRWGKKTDNAHPPIHPTKFTNTLQGNEKRIYELVVRHFLACCSQDAEGSETIVEITIARELFAVQGLIIIAKNYLEVYPYDRWSDKPLPAFVEGQQFQPTNISMVEGRTEPPPLLTESNLIDLMDKNGIGTDATHAEHIETIKARKYVAVQNGRFVPGELGIGLVEGYDSMGFEMSKPKLRAELETGLKRICEGTRNKTEVLQEQITKYKEVFVKAAAEATKLDVALSKYLINESDQIMDNFQDDPPSDGPTQTNTHNTFSRSTVDHIGDNNNRSNSRYPRNRSNFGGNRDNSRNRKSNSSTGFSTYRNNDGQAGNEIVCNCEEEAILLTVKKQGPNCGRQFYKCNKRDSSACGFFLWADEPQNQAQRGSSGSRTFSSNNAFPGSSGLHDGNTSGDNSCVKCLCDIPAVSRTVQKEGANKGRQFYCCSKPQGNQCTFFKWVDDTSAATTSNWNENGTKRSYRGRRGRGPRGSRGSRGSYRRKRTKTYNGNQEDYYGDDPYEEDYD